MLPDPTFYDEFRRQGQLLVPALLALVRLYRWLITHGVEAVPEGKLREFLAQGEADVLAGEPTLVNTPRLRYSGIIRDLQKYRLLRGVASGPATYRPKLYARALCKRLHTTLFSKLVVSEVAANFRRMKDNLGEGNEAFPRWARELLPTLNLDVAQQLVALDNDIDTTLKKLRHQTSHTEETFLVMLQEVDTTLVDLLQKATELNRAFHHAAGLEQQLTCIWTGNEQEREAVNREARQAPRFIDQARLRLDELSERLSWGHPRVQALFGHLSKRRFARKTERFLPALLRAEPETGPDLLAGVPLAQLAYQPLRFDRVPTAGQVLPVEWGQAPKRVANAPAQQAFQARTEEQLRRRQGRYWLGELHRLPATTGASVSFGEFGQRLAAAAGAAAYELLHFWRHDLAADAPANVVFSASQQVLIRQLIASNTWLAEESSEFTDLMRASGVAST